MIYNIKRTVNKFPTHILLFIFAYRRRVQIIGEEEYTQYEKHDEQFHQNNEPQSFPERHTSESIDVKPPDFLDCILHNREIIIITNIKLLYFK